jgi:copper resistance protein D
MADEGLILSRFVHYAALLFAFGACLFPIYAFSGSERQGALEHRNKHKSSLLAASLIALASGLSWLLFTAAAMAGSLSEALNPETMGAVFADTGFGLVWSVHLGLVAGLALLAGRDRRAPRPHAISLVTLSAACLASLGGVGHSQSQEGVNLLVHVIADGTHLLAAGAWLGGLVPLLAMLMSRPYPDGRREPGIGHVLMRFSGMGYAAVALLVGTGAINSWYLLPSPSRLPVSLYGQLLIIKLGLFALMLLLAAMNRFWLVPGLLASRRGPQSKACLLRLRRHVIGEQVFGALIIALVSVLGTLAPPEGQ